MRKRLSRTAFAIVITAGTVSAALITANAAPTTAAPAVAPPASGKTITVGPGGDYATIQEAADTAQPGDNVEIAAGNYEGGLNITKSGAPGRYITFLGRGGAAVVDGGGGDDGLISIGTSSWIRFVDVTSAGSDGFGIMANGAHDLEFQHIKVDGSEEGGLVLLNTSNVLVDGCEITGTNAKGTSANHEAMSLGSGGSNIEVRDCKVHDNGEEGIDVKYADDAKAKIHDNLVYGNRGPVIYLDGSSNVEVYNNTVYGNANAGLTFWKESDGSLSDIQIVNNTCHGNANGAVTFGVDDIGGKNLLRNNIFGEGDVSDDNFVSDGNLAGDPGFADPQGGDFHLKPGAKGIDAGSPDGAPAFDRDNAKRPKGAGVDVGAYER